METRSRLSKIKLRMTPRRLAIQYIVWMHRSLVTLEPDPSTDLMKQMRSEILAACGTVLHEPVVDRAEQEALFLILVYSHAIFNLIEMIGATSELDLIVLSLNVKPGSCPELLSQLTARVNSLSLSMAVLDKFQTDYLGALVLPDHFRVIFEVVRAITGLTLEALGDGYYRDTASFPKTCSDELVRQGIASLKSLIRNWGKLGWVHSVAHKLTLLYLETGMLRLVMDHKRCAQLVTMRALGIQPINNPEDAVQQQETRARSKSKSRQRPRTKPTTKSLLASRHRRS